MCSTSTCSNEYCNHPQTSLHSTVICFKCKLHGIMVLRYQVHITARLMCILDEIFLVFHNTFRLIPLYKSLHTFKAITHYIWPANHFALHYEHFFAYILTSTPLPYSSFTHYVLTINCMCIGHGWFPQHSCAYHEESKWQWQIFSWQDY